MQLLWPAEARHMVCWESCLCCSYWGWGAVPTSPRQAMPFLQPLDVVACGRLFGGARGGEPDRKKIKRRQR